MVDNTQVKPKKSSLSGCLGRLIVVMSVLFALTVVGLGVWVRTDHGRGTIEKRLTNRLGVDVSIRSARLAFPLGLQIDGVTPTVDDPGNEPGTMIGKIIIQPLPGTIRVTVEDAQVNLMRTDDSWSPDCLSEVGELLGMDLTQVTRASMRYRDSYHIIVRNGSVVWRDSDGGELGKATGVSFVLSRAAMPNRVLYYHSLGVTDMCWTEGSAAENIRREWMAFDGCEYVKLYGEGTPKGERAQAFWDPTVGAEDASVRRAK